MEKQEPTFGMQNSYDIMLHESNVLAEEFYDMHRFLTSGVASGDARMSAETFGQIINLSLRCESFMYYVRDYAEHVKALREYLSKTVIYENEILNEVNNTISEYGLRKDLADHDDIAFNS